MLRLRSSRLLSLANPHLGAMRLSLELVSGEPCPGLGARRRVGPPEVGRAPARRDHGRRRRRRRGHAPHPHPGRTGRGRCRPGADGHRSATQPIDAAHVTDEHFSGREFDVELIAGAPLEIERHVAVFTEREEPDSGRQGRRRRSQLTGRRVGRAVCSAHATAWASAWARSDVEIDEPAAQLGIRFAVAQLIAVAPAGGQPHVGRGQRPHRRGLQGPRVLGHRRVPDAVLRLHHARGRPRDHRLPGGHAPGGAPKRRERRARRRVVRLGERRQRRGCHPRLRGRPGRSADGGEDRRAGDPRRQRHRACDRDVRACHRRPRGAHRRRRRAAGRSRTLLRHPRRRDRPRVRDPCT